MMKFSKNILLIVVILQSPSLVAKRRGVPAPRAAEQPPARPTTPTTQPIQKPQPIQSAESYKDLVAFVKNAGNAWDNSRSILRTDFVNTVIQKAQAANLDGFQLEALLQTARDLHGIFSGDQNKDIATLQSVNNQIATAINQR